MISPYRLGWIALPATLAAICAAAVASAYINHDAAWYLHMAAVWLDGGRLYRDVLDTNPPLIVFLTAVPLWVARRLGLSTPAAFLTFVFVLAGAAAAFAVQPIRRTWKHESCRLSMALLLVFALLPFVRDDFGQREHVAVILIAPFVLQACARAAGRATAGVAEAAGGALAGLGFAMKPHFLIAWASLEIALMVLGPQSRSWRRRGTMAAAGVVLAYAALVLVLVPDYLPMARDARQVYSGLDQPFGRVFGATELRVWGAALVALALVRLPSTSRGPVVVLFAVATGFLAAALLQLKGWGYHFYPFRALVVLFAGAVAAAIADAHPAALGVVRGGRRTLTALLFAFLTLWSARAAADARRSAADGYVSSLVHLLQRQPRAESIAMLSMRTIIFPVFPAATYLHATWVLRHNSLWFLPGLYAAEMNTGEGDVQFRRVTAMPPLERKYFDQILEDLCARPPRILIVEPPIPGAPPGRRSLDLIAYYGQDPRFDRLFAAYAPIGSVGPFVAYSRSGDASCQGPAR